MLDFYSRGSPNFMAPSSSQRRRELGLNSGDGIAVMLTIPVA